MKSGATSMQLPADFPKNEAEWEALIAKASGVDRWPTQEELDDGVVVISGGLAAARKALGVRRRGPGKRPAKQLVSLRLPGEVLERWKATGAGWQTRMAERLAQPIPMAKPEGTRRR